MTGVSLIFLIQDLYRSEKPRISQGGSVRGGCVRNDDIDWIEHIEMHMFFVQFGTIAEYLLLGKQSYCEPRSNLLFCQYALQMLHQTFQAQISQPFIASQILEIFKVRRGNIPLEARRFDLDARVNGTRLRVAASRTGRFWCRKDRHRGLVRAGKWKKVFFWQILRL